MCLALSKGAVAPSGVSAILPSPALLISAAAAIGHEADDADASRGYGAPHETAATHGRAAGPGLVVLAQVTVWTGDVSGPHALVALIALTMTVPLAWRRALPLAVFGAALAAVIALGAVDSSLDDFYTLLAPLVAIEAVGAHVALRRSAAALALTLGVVVPGER
jgi:hypothetical protein